MAEPCGFEEQNRTFGPPGGLSEDQCGTIFAFSGRTDMINLPDIPAVITCWKLRADELAEINRTGRVWMIVPGRGLFAHSLSGFKPAMREGPPV